MNSRRQDIKRKIRKIIEEETHKYLVLPIDHSKAVESEEVTDEQEVIDHSTGKVVKISDRLPLVGEKFLRSLVSNIIKDHS